MDYERKDMQDNQDWIDEVLGSGSPQRDLGPDEHAVYSAGLIHPDDMELEMILAEHRQEALEAEISAAVEAAMVEQALPVSDKRETFVGLDVDVQEAISNEVTQFIDISQEVPADGPEIDPAPEEAPVSLEETQFFSEIPEEPASEEVPAVAEPLQSVEELPQEEEPPVAKQRPKRKKGYGLWGIPHLLSTIVWLAIIVAIGISLGRTLWLCCADVMAFGKGDKEVVITISDNDDIESISQTLADKGLIRYPWLFQKFAEITNKSDNISKGTFTLNSRLDYNAMINSMSIYAASREEVDVMFPEGYTCAQIFELLEEKNVCTVAALEEYAANGELDDYWFLEGVERGDKYCLEGYLFPDTYTFYTNDEPRRVLEKFLDCFDVRFTDIMRERLEQINIDFADWLADEGYGQEYIDSHKITIREAVIIASLIEKESSGGDENYTISSVIYNRLTDSSQPPYLNIDAALIYGLGGKKDPITGESIPLTTEDLATDNPYNTYLYTGLTPGPICNPGQECLNAALTPDDTNYYYYALNPETGTHKFFKTYKEHQKFLDSLD